MRRFNRYLLLTALVLGISVWGLWASRSNDVSAGGVTVSTGDVNGDSLTNLGDAIYLLDYLFNGGAAPVEIPCGSIRDIPNGNDQFRQRAFEDLQEFAGSALVLDPDSVQIGSLPQGLFVEAMIDGFEDLVGPDDFFPGVIVGVIYLGFTIPGPAGGASIPPGFYQSRLLFDEMIYATGDPNFARSFLVDDSGFAHELPTSHVHFPGSSPIAALGVRSEICNETAALRGRRYVSCPQLGDLLAMSCIDSVYMLP